MKLRSVLYAASALVAVSATGAFAQTTITIATVNNGDMITMQSLMGDFNAKHPDINVEWVTLEENVLRQNVTTDISTGGGQYDVLTIGTYEVPIWGANDWLVSLNDLPAEYNVDDIIPAIRGGLSVDGELYAAPFYAESSFTIYRRDLMEAAGLEMPEAPTWEFIREAAAAMTDRDNDINGICLRGKAGWGENMALLTAMSNSFGARWFDEDWNAQFDSEAWANTVNFYLEMMEESGPAGAANNGFNENLTLFQQGKCGIWIDATSAGQFVVNDDFDRRRPGRLRSGARHGSGQARQLALGLVAGDPDIVGQSGRRQDLHQLGDRSGVRRARRRGEGLGRRSSGHPRVPLRGQPVSRRGSLRAGDRQLDGHGRSDQSDGRSGSLYRHPVRRDPGIRRHRDPGRPGDGRSTRGPADRRGGSREIAGADRRRNGSRGLLSLDFEGRAERSALLPSASHPGFP